MTDNGTRTVVAALHRLSDDVDAPPTVLTDAYRRANRLRRRHRTVLAAVLVLALAAAGTGLQWYANTRPGPDQTAAHTVADLLTQPTRGDLAGDTTYRKQVLAAWQAGSDQWPDAIREQKKATYYYAPEPRDPASVVLAQHTPAGPAAIVVQRASLVIVARPGTTPPSGLPKEEFYVGYLDAGAGGKPALLTVGQYQPTDPVRGLAFLAGADRSWLVVLSTGDALSFSSGRRYPADAAPTRQFSPIPLNDGVAVVAVPAGAARTELAVAVPPASRFEDGVPVANTQPITKNLEIPDQDNRLFWLGQLWVLPNERAASAAWGVPNLVRHAYGETLPADPVVSAWRRSFNAEQVDPFATSSGESVWYAAGALPDGRAFVVGDGQLGDDPSYLYGAVIDHGKQTTIYGGKVDPNAALPVRLRFPDGQGWLVAAKGATFQYLTDGWHDAGTNAALLPANATQVRVTPAHGATTVLPLS